MKKRIALFPGSFDPFTKGHEDIVLRSLNLFDELHVVIGHNTYKKRHFDIQWMIGRLKTLFEKYENIKVDTYNELTAEYAKKKNAGYILRGLRNTTDFEFENSIAQINNDLCPNLETIFLITSPKFAYISSTVIREVHSYGGDISKYLPYKI